MDTRWTDLKWRRPHWCHYSWGSFRISSSAWTASVWTLRSTHALRLYSSLNQVCSVLYTRMRISLNDIVCSRFLVPVWFKSNNFYLNPVSVLIYPLTCFRCEGTAWLVTSGGIAGPGADNAVWLCQQPETSENAIWKTTTATSGTAQREFSRSWGHFLPENNWQHSNRKNLVWHV